MAQGAHIQVRPESFQSSTIYYECDDFHIPEGTRTRTLRAGWDCTPCQKAVEMARAEVLLACKVLKRQILSTKVSPIVLGVATAKDLLAFQTPKRQILSQHASQTVIRRARAEVLLARTTSKRQIFNSIAWRIFPGAARDIVLLACKTFSTLHFEQKYYPKSHHDVWHSRPVCLPASDAGNTCSGKEDTRQKKISVTSYSIESCSAHEICLVYHATRSKTNTWSSYPTASKCRKFLSVLMHKLLSIENMHEILMSCLKPFLSSRITREFKTSWSLTCKYISVYFTRSRKLSNA